MTRRASPPKQGLYDPAHEHDSCGIGFVVDAHGRKSHSIVEQGVQVLLNLEHRGACGCEKNTGDGAGILMQMPHRFLAEECDKIGITLPAAGRYGAGIVFLPRDARGRADCEEVWKRLGAEEGMPVLGWRDLPTDNRTLGPSAVAGRTPLFTSRWPPSLPNTANRRSSAAPAERRDCCRRDRAGRPAQRGGVSTRAGWLQKM